MMAILEATKEKIGLYKLFLGVFIAVIVSVSGWLFQNFDNLNNSKIVYVIFLLMVLNFSAFLLYKKVVFLIEYLKGL